MYTSIIIPTYNRSDVIIRSLETWTKQTIPTSEFEVIVVDNNSSDNSAELIKEYIKPFSNFHYLFEEKPGATNARHAGVEIAKGDILIFCDDDGLFNINFIQSVLNVYRDRPEVSAVASKIEILWDDVAPTWIKPYLFMLGELDYGSEVCYKYDLYINGGAFSIRKKVFYELCGFNPDLVGMYLVGDGDTGLVKKLHKTHKLIGWTPFAVMRHMQFVNKQGTIDDLGRRFLNTGISNAYGLFYENNFKFNLRVLMFIINSIVFFAKKKLELLLITSDKTQRYFSMMQRKGEIKFFINLRLKQIRNVIYQ